MAFFKKPGGFGGGRGGDRGNDRGPSRFGDKPRFGDRKPSFGGKPGGFRGGDDRGGFGARPPVQLFKATCAECGNACEVPFRPSGEKPVYCSNCFTGNKDRDSGRSFEKRDFKPRDRDSFKPRDSFAPAPAVADKRIDEIKKQLDAMQAKINDILQMLTIYKIDEASKRQPVIEPKKKAVPTPAPVSTPKKKATATAVTPKKKATPKKK